MASRLRVTFALLSCLLLSARAAEQDDHGSLTILPSGTVIANDALQPLKNRTGLLRKLPRYIVPIEDRGYALSQAKWPTLRIPLCWEKFPDHEKESRKLVQLAIQETWERYSPVRFVGWDIACSPDSRAIRILVNDSGAMTKGLGKFIANSRRNGMILNFTFKNWNRSCSKAENTKACIYMIAVHEFGHALGFAHEQNRFDTPGECSKRPQGPNGDTFLTSWELDSVMNYCSPTFSSPEELATIRSLSHGDRCAVQAFYGPPEDHKFLESCDDILLRR